MLHRHDIVHVDARALRDAPPADAVLPTCAGEWIETGRPLVVRRQGSCDPPCEVALGLSLPQRRRIALTLPARVIDSVTRPPTLADVIPHVPVRWRRALAQLDTDAASVGISFRVYGSVAWQMLTALPYVTDESDIDLLWHPAGRSQLSEGIALLERWERVTGLRADGEIVFGDGDAVAWREWSQRDRPAAVLVKRLEGPEMRRAAELLRALDRYAAEWLA